MTTSRVYAETPQNGSPPRAAPTVWTLLQAGGAFWRGCRFPNPALERYFLHGDGATDSAAAATALATGTKTDSGNIAWLPGDPADGGVRTIAENLRTEKDFAIGVVSTVPFTHATPAGFVSHNVARDNSWDIGHEILFDVQPEVVIGGGLGSLFSTAVKDAVGGDRDLDKNGRNDDYDAFVAGTDGTGYYFVGRGDSDGGEALRRAAAAVDLGAGQMLFGLFGVAKGNFRYFDTLDTPGAPTIRRGTAGQASSGTQRIDPDPTLKDAALAALDVLSQDRDGFFVMCEQGDIDWSNHANNYESLIGGVHDLDQAVRGVEAFVDRPGDAIDWDNTLVLVTSDHSNSYMRLSKWLGRGDLLRQVAAEGKNPSAGAGIQWNYPGGPSSPGSHWSYPDGEVTYGRTSHTNELVTLWARGRGAELFGEYAGRWWPGTRIVDNTQIHDAMAHAADCGARHIVLFVGDGMNLEHEIAGSRYLYDRDFGLAWHDWGELPDGWCGFAATWDVNTYNRYARRAGAKPYDPSAPTGPGQRGANDPIHGYDPAQGGAAPERIASLAGYTVNTLSAVLCGDRPADTAWLADICVAASLVGQGDTVARARCGEPR